MKKIILVVSLLLALMGFSKQTSAQYYFYNDSYYDSPVLFEGGISVGAMNCFTDVGGKKGVGKKFIKDLNFGNTNFAGGVYVNAMFKNAIGLRLEGTFGKLSASDSVLKGVTDIAKERYNRNLSFRTNITEISLLAEIHPLFIFINWEERDQPQPRYSPYLIAGVGFFSYNPQAMIGNSWIDLQPLSTEGQGFKEYPDRKPYKLQQMNIPLGAGIKYELSPLLNVRAEFLYRKLNTDYLDDVSTTYIDPALYAAYFPVASSKYQYAMLLNDRQIESHTSAGGKRGSPKQKDAYFSFNLKLGLVIGRQRIK
jgi:hypothetical protein